MNSYKVKNTDFFGWKQGAFQNEIFFKMKWETYRNRLQIPFYNRKNPEPFSFNVRLSNGDVKSFYCGSKKATYFRYEGFVEIEASLVG